MELVVPWLLARMIPCVSRASGRSAALTSDGYFARSVFCFEMRILKPAEGFPKDPVTATISPGRAPRLRTSSFAFASPTPTMSITRSSAWFVSPPMILQWYSRAAWLRPRAISCTVAFCGEVADGGNDGLSCRFLNCHSWWDVGAADEHVCLHDDPGLR